MSVRRLAEDSVQPAGFAFSGENVIWAERAIQKFPEGRQQSAVIPLLMRAQEQDGWVTKAAIEHIAGMLKMPLIRVLEVATFYTQFQLKPVGTKAHIQVCGTTPCMLRGSDALKRVCQSKIHAEQFQLNASGTLSWEEVECLGACVNAPMVMVFKDTYEDLTPERLEAIIDQFERGEDVKVGPQIDRHASAPEGGLTSLTTPDGDEGAEGSADSGPAKNGAAAQGSGAGAAGAPSLAGRPTSHAAETDPTIKGPGKAANADASQAADTASSVDPAAGAKASGAGSAGGAVAGPTGAYEKEADAEAAAKRDASRAEAEVATPTEAARRSDDVVAAPPVVGEPKASGDDKAPVATATVTPGGAVDATDATIVGEKPAGLLAAPEGDKDDLQIIKGIGPVIEAKLHDLGIFHFRQIAAWTTKELVWIDDYLNFRGRAVRENWVAQAKDLDAKRSEVR